MSNFEYLFRFFPLSLPTEINHKYSKFDPSKLMSCRGHYLQQISISWELGIKSRFERLKLPHRLIWNKTKLLISKSKKYVLMYFQKQCWNMYLLAAAWDLVRTLANDWRDLYSILFDCFQIGFGSTNNSFNQFCFGSRLWQISFSCFVYLFSSALFFL